MGGRSIRLPIGALLSMLAGTALLAQVPGPPPPVSPPRSPAPEVPARGGLSDRAEIETFIDGVVAAQEQTLQVASLTVAVVSKGELFFAKGYGFADRAAGKKVDPERTLFRIASVSKLFTWTAVMQQVERGRLDLKADVNKYLVGSPVRVPETYARPITMIDLMTHTAGFEDRVIGLVSNSPTLMRPLGELLAAEMPTRVRPPGTVASYSNYGAALAGYIVERLAGVRFEQYVEEHLLRPLEMAHTTVRQPIPSPLASDVAVGYDFAAGEHTPQRFVYLPLSPAGSMSASAVDMAHFMIAHLQDGRYREARILSEDTTRQMHTRVFGHADTVNGMMHGFYEMNRNGRRIYGHGGGLRRFFTQLALLPDEQVGIFVSCTGSRASSSAPQALLKALLDRYYPDIAPARAAPGKPHEPAGTFAGRYRSTRMSYTSLAKVMALMGVGVVTVRELPDGRLLTTGFSGYPMRWVEVWPLTFLNAETGDRIAFLKDSTGRVSHLGVGDLPFVIFERLDVWETPRFHYALLALALSILLSSIVAWPVVAWSGRRKRTVSTPPRWGRLVLWMASAIILASIAGLRATLPNPDTVWFDVYPGLKAALALPVAGAFLTAAAFVFAVRAWVRHYWRPAARAYYTLVVAAAILFLAVLDHWNLLGYRLH